MLCFQFFFFFFYFCIFCFFVINHFLYNPPTNLPILDLFLLSFHKSHSSFWCIYYILFSLSTSLHFHRYRYIHFFFSFIFSFTHTHNHRFYILCIMLLHSASSRLHIIVREKINKKTFLYCFIIAAALLFIMHNEM